MDLKIGDRLPPFQRKVDLEHWNRYAAVNEEFVWFHMDDGAGQRAGFPGAIGMGNLQLAYLHCLIRGWTGPSGRILSLSCQHRRYNVRGETLTCHGTVTGLREQQGLQVADLEIWVENEHGTVLSPGTASVQVPR